MPWRCSSLMMRPSVQLRLCFGLSALAVVFAAGLVVVAGAEGGVGVGGGVAGGRGRRPWWSSVWVGRPPQAQQAKPPAGDRDISELRLLALLRSPASARQQV